MAKPPRDIFQNCLVRLPLEIEAGSFLNERKLQMPLLGGRKRNVSKKLEKNAQTMRTTTLRAYCMRLNSRQTQARAVPGEKVGALRPCGRDGRVGGGGGRRGREGGRRPWREKKRERQKQAERSCQQWRALSGFTSVQAR